MRVLGLDFETTGLDFNNDRIIEIGAAIWDTDKKTVIYGYGSYVSDDSITITSEITKITGIEQSVLTEFGKSPFSALRQLHDIALGSKIEYVVAHNGQAFDKPFLKKELERHGLPKNLVELPWIDTRIDLPFETEPESRRLKHLALDAGFINPFPHRAQYDVLTMLKVMSQFEFNKIVEYSKLPNIVIRAKVDYDQRNLAKERRYSWQELGDKKYDKCWVKLIKQDRLEEERKNSPFEILVLS